MCDIWNAEEEPRKMMWYFTKRYVRVCFVTFHFAAKKVQEDPEVRRHCLWHFESKAAPLGGRRSLPVPPQHEC